MKSFLPFESSGACESVNCWVWHLSHFDCMNAPLYLRPITFTSSVSGSFQSWSSSPCRKARWRTPLVWTPCPPWQVVHPNVSGLCALVRSSQRWGCVRKTGFTSNGSVFTASSSAATVSLSEQACATLSSIGFSSPSIASRAGLREMPFHSGFCSTSTAPFASLRTVFVFPNQAAVGPPMGLAPSHPLPPLRPGTALGGLGRFHRRRLRRWLVPADGDGIGRTGYVLADSLADL